MRTGDSNLGQEYTQVLFNQAAPKGPDGKPMTPAQVCQWQDRARAHADPALSRAILDFVADAVASDPTGATLSASTGETAAREVAGRHGANVWLSVAWAGANRHMVPRGR